MSHVLHESCDMSDPSFSVHNRQQIIPALDIALVWCAGVDNSPMHEVLARVLVVVGIPQ